MSRVARKPVSDKNRAVQRQKMGRGLKFQISDVDELYDPSSENEGTD